MMKSIRKGFAQKPVAPANLRESSRIRLKNRRKPAKISGRLKENVTLFESFRVFVRRYKFSLAVCAALVFAHAGFAFPACAQNPPPDGQLVSREAYRFPSYQAAVEKTGAENYATEEEYETAVADKNFEFSKLTYASDGLKVRAYLYKPKKPKGKLPVIVFNRGSFVRGDIAPELVALFRRLALEGFAVIAPLYRQSDGGEGRDEMGGADVDDLMNVVPLVKAFEFADAENLFLYGESRGGIMTYLALKRNFPARAAAVFGAITDLEDYQKANARDISPEFLKSIWADYDANKEKILSERSAIRWPERINAPILIMHGGGDPQVDPLQSLALAAKLQASGKQYQLKIFAGDNHILSKNRVERDRETIRWFKYFMKPRV
ncbi:MAG TPA: prolyl oligopeptidase family serine peptidase [Pyrinomonadaceae bacterium]